MLNRGRCLVVFGLLLAITAIASDPEPTYQGRSLSEWLRDLDPHGMYPANDPPPEIVAIRKIGTNALPLLLKWIQAEDPWEAPKPNLAPCYNMPRSERAARAFAILGDTAVPAVPKLTRFALTTRNEQRADRCIDALAGIGPASMPSFIKIMTTGRYGARFSALESLPGLQTDNTPALQAIITCLTEKDESLGLRAAQTLCEASIPEPILIPALTNALQTASPPGRAHIYRCLSWLKIPAHAAIPAVRVGLSDRNGEVRTNAIWAAQRIAPDLLAAAPKK